MLLQAQRDLGIDLKQSFMIGDKYLDVGVGHAAGARSVLVLTGYGREELEEHKGDPEQPDFVAENLLEAVEAITSGKYA
jgi:phosphoglycolate phosphatase-like HAD superfamily hydrolase